MPKVVVTGGLGFIGSHTVVELQQSGFEVLIIDDLSNASIEVLDGITKITGSTPAFFEFDLKEKDKVHAFFKSHDDISGVIHFAASKAVGESVLKPLKYYENNINTLVYILQEIDELKDANFIFSSSCTVYGQAESLPIDEDAPVQKAASPYGNTKQIGEEIIMEHCQVNPDFNAISLRYFNPIGAHESAHIGELPKGVPQNLVPYITQTAAGIRKELAVFGDDYNTRDGTCIRDYIHVIDLAQAHVVALQRLLDHQNTHNYEMYNLGTGEGSTVLEVIRSFERVSGVKLNYKMSPRRAGDVEAAYAKTEKANTILGWKTQRSLDDAMRDAWRWQQKITIKNQK